MGILAEILQWRTDVPGTNAEAAGSMLGWEKVARIYTTLRHAVHGSPEHLRGRCPFCWTDWDSFVVYWDENLYGCEASAAGSIGGDVIDFVARLNACRTERRPPFTGFLFFTGQAGKTVSKGVAIPPAKDVLNMAGPLARIPPLANAA